MSLATTVTAGLVLGTPAAPLTCQCTSASATAAMAPGQPCSASCAGPHAWHCLPSLLLPPLSEPPCRARGCGSLPCQRGHAPAGLPLFLLRLPLDLPPACPRLLFLSCLPVTQAGVGADQESGRGSFSSLALQLNLPLHPHGSIPASSASSALLQPLFPFPQLEEVLGWTRRGGRGRGCRCLQCRLLVLPPFTPLLHHHHHHVERHPVPIYYPLSTCTLLRG